MSAEAEEEEGTTLGMILAVAATTHGANGFFMNWLGTPRGEGFEYHLLGIAIALAIVVRGSGAWSADRAISGPVTGDGT